MSDPESDKADESDAEEPREEIKMPDGIAPPPMPKPDLHDIVKEGPTYGEQGKDTGKGKKKKKRGRKQESKSKHPLDSVTISAKSSGSGKSMKGCCGCFSGCLVLVVLSFLTLFIVVGWLGPARHLVKDHEVVNHLDSPSITITTAPTKPTAFLGNEIIYNVPQTKVPVAIYGQKITVSGDFWEDVTLTGTKVTGTPTARFAKNLEIWAAEFIDEGLTLKGELLGRVMQNTDPADAANEEN